MSIIKISYSYVVSTDYLLEYLFAGFMEYTYSYSF